MNQGCAYTELILKEIFQGEKPASCAHFLPLLPLTTTAMVFENPFLFCEWYGPLPYSAVWFSFYFQVERKENGHLSDHSVVTATLCLKCFLLSKTFPVFNLSATASLGSGPGGLVQASTVPQILFRAMDSHTSLHYGFLDIPNK